MMRKIILLFVLVVFSSGLWAQSSDITGSNAITSAVPFLTIAPDSRSSAMGDVGAATSPDISSQAWNPAKYAFMEGKAGIGISYIPWMRKLVNDMNILYMSGYFKFDENQALSGSVRYFNYGEVELTNSGNQVIGTSTPNEFAIDAGYSRKLNDNWSGAVVGRFIHSDLGVDMADDTYSAGNAFAVDVAFFYHYDWQAAGAGDHEIAWGVNFQNIGTKISYDEGNTKDFLPMNFKTGIGYTYKADKYNRLTATVDMNKLLVPTPDTTAIANEEGIAIGNGDATDVSVINSIFSSWSDAPGGFKEEMQEMQWSLGLEYWYNNQFALRTGYFYENPNKGNRQYVTFGAGFAMNVFGLDFSYMIPTASNNNALGNTLRFSLLFNLDKIGKGSASKTDDILML